MRFLRVSKFFVVSLFIVASMAMYSANVQAYYGGFGGIAGSSFGLGNPYYGSGGLYGGLYGLYGGLYGGVDTLYGPYSLSSGIAGLYGLGGLGLIGGAGLVRQAQAPVATTTIPVLPNPTGSWLGTWVSYISLKSGTANFQLLYTPGTLVISGTAGLLLNKLVPIPINVSGINSATGFTLEGTYFNLTTLTNLTVSYTCTLSTPSFITGTYLIHDALYLQTDTGTVGLSLANPVPII
ncbi:MAG: hypothetical protein AB1847_09630 [bacterium]